MELLFRRTRRPASTFWKPEWKKEYYVSLAFFDHGEVWSSAWDVMRIRNTSRNVCTAMNC